MKKLIDNLGVIIVVLIITLIILLVDIIPLLMRFGLFQKELVF